MASSTTAASDAENRLRRYDHVSDALAILHWLRLPERVNFKLAVARCPVFDRTVRFFGDLSGQKYDAKPDN